MAENFFELSKEDLRKQIPRDTFIGRWRSRFGKSVELVTPDGEQLLKSKVEGGGIETKKLVEETVESAKREKESTRKLNDAMLQISSDPSAVEVVVEAAMVSNRAAEQLSGLVQKMKMGSPISNPGIDFNALIAADREEIADKRKYISDQGKILLSANSEIFEERGASPDIPVAEDLKLLEDVVGAEKKVVFLASMVSEALGRLKIDGADIIDVDRLMQLVTAGKDERQNAVSVIAGAEEVMHGLKILSKQRVARKPEEATDWENTVSNYEGHVLEIGDPKIQPKEKDLDAVILMSEMGERLDDLKIKEGRVRVNILERVGIKDGEIDKNGLLAKRENHRASYEAAIQKMEALLKASEQRPTAAVEAYLALNHAIVEGSAVVQLDNAIKIVMMKTKTDFMSLVLKSIPMPNEKAGALLLKFDMFGRKSEGRYYEIVGKVARSIEAKAKALAEWAESEADRAKGKNFTNTNN